ncbi:MAG: hypothetical protein C6Y20_17115 [Tagaea sp. CACIAM 22H2]|nr:hypothetical protein [Tagaea sp. CACIAM 22H2]
MLSRDNPGATAAKISIVAGFPRIGAWRASSAGIGIGDERYDPPYIHTKAWTEAGFRRDGIVREPAANVVMSATTV